MRERTAGATAYLFVEDSDTLAQTWRAAGADVRPPQDTEWGSRTVSAYLWYTPRTGLTTFLVRSGLPRTAMNSPSLTGG